MTAVSSAPSNSLVASLPRRERARLMRACEPVDMVRGDVLYEAGQPCHRVYFPQSGLISQSSALDGHSPLGMSLIGAEGVLGATILLGVDEAPMQARVERAGVALSIPVGEMRRQMRNGDGLRAVMGRHLYLQLVTLSVTAACTQFHQIDQRLARLLLTTQDRLQDDHFHFTHGALATMLGVRRSGVTVAAGTLQSAGLISYSRGEIAVLDRAGLESRSCACHARLIGRGMCGGIPT